MTRSKIVVFDLDGTLIKVNTFNVFLKHCFFLSIKYLRIVDLIRLFLIILRRKVIHIPRSEFKHELHKLFQKYYSDQQFNLSCMKMVNENVLSELKKHLKDPNAYVILNTAAMPYAVYLAEKFSISEVLCSYEANNIWIENSSNIKVERLQTKGIDKVTVLFTDDLEDSPLMEFSNSIFLVNPKDATKEYANKLGTEIRIIR